MTVHPTATMRVWGHVLAFPTPDSACPSAFSSERALWCEVLPAGFSNPFCDVGPQALESGPVLLTPNMPGLGVVIGSLPAPCLAFLPAQPGIFLLPFQGIVGSQGVFVLTRSRAVFIKAKTSTSLLSQGWEHSLLRQELNEYTKLGLFSF